MFNEDKIITSMANLLLHIGEFLEERYGHLDGNNDDYYKSTEYCVMVNSLYDLKEHFQQEVSGYQYNKRNNKDE